MASVSVPAEASAVIRLFLGLYKINVMAPARMLRLDALPHCYDVPQQRAASAEEKWLISGLNCGLCFAENMRATADALVATAPSP